MNNIMIYEFVKNSYTETMCQILFD